MMYYNLNRIFYSGAVIFLLASCVAISCQNKNEEAASDTEKTATEVKENATNQPKSEWTVFHEAIERNITANEERIKTLKENIRKPGTPNLDKLRAKRIDELQERNAALRARLGEYKEGVSKTDYEKFKADVQKQLDEMEKELKDLDKD